MLIGRLVGTALYYDDLLIIIINIISAPDNLIPSVTRMIRGQQQKNQVSDTQLPTQH